MAKKIQQKKSMIVKYDLFPGFLCYSIGKTRRGKNVYHAYEIEGTNTYIEKTNVIKVVTRREGEQIKTAIDDCRGRRSDAIDELTKSMIARLNNQIVDILMD
jgi:hypothetical protein